MAARRGVVTGRAAPLAPSPWTRGVIVTLVFAALVVGVPLAGAALASAVLHGVYSDRERLPDVGPLTRFELPTVGRIYDASGQVLIELARQQRSISRFDDIPPVVRDAILATEDERFFSHDGSTI